MYTVALPVGCAEKICCAIFCLVVSPVNSDIGISTVTHFFNSGFSTTTSCSTSSPPPYAPSAPKSTSFNLINVASGVHTSNLTLVAKVISNCSAAVSIPTKSKLEYFFTLLPARVTSS